MTKRLTNSDVLAGEGNARAHVAYRALVAAHGHNSLCRAYGLDTDDVNGGTYWRDVVVQAFMHGDIDENGNLT